MISLSILNKILTIAIKISPSLFFFSPVRPNRGELFCLTFCEHLFISYCIIHLTVAMEMEPCSVDRS